MNMQGNDQNNEADDSESAEVDDWVDRLSNCTGHHHESMVAVAEVGGTGPLEIAYGRRSRLATRPMFNDVPTH